MIAYAAVDDFLRANYRLGLETALGEGCLMGRLDAALAGRARLLPRLVQSTGGEDGGSAEHYEGILILDGVWYRFRCRVHVEGSGRHLLSEVSEFAAVEWRSHLAVAA